MARSLVLGSKEIKTDVTVVGGASSVPFGEGSAATRCARNDSTLPEGGSPVGRSRED